MLSTPWKGNDVFQLPFGSLLFDFRAKLSVAENENANIRIRFRDQGYGVHVSDEILGCIEVGNGQQEGKRKSGVWRWESFCEPLLPENV